MCGGNIQAAGETHGICDSCGSEVTLPKIDDDKRTAFYERGNYFRQKGEFDKAYASFEHIIADDIIMVIGVFLIIAGFMAKIHIED